MRMEITRLMMKLFEIVETKQTKIILVQNRDRAFGTDFTDSYSIQTDIQHIPDDIF